MPRIAVETFAQWRQAARQALRDRWDPGTILWTETSQDALPLDITNTVVELPTNSSTKVPQEFLSLAEMASCYRDPQRWSLLYRILWRLQHGKPQLLQIEVDSDVRKLRIMEKRVRRDIHKMHAFVRFRRVQTENSDHYVAWHSPDHYILTHTAPFFVRRFGAMNWTLLTPDASVSWDQANLKWGPGVPRSEAPSEDALEPLWRQYYAAIFNPARIKVQAMKKEMAVRHWPTMPETSLIPSLLRDAPQRVAQMKALQPASAAPLIAPQATLEDLRQAAAACRACDLCDSATQTVFGEGPRNASIVLIGEQPGDEEDLAGRPFVGPAGRLLDEALIAAGFDRKTLYVTNAVKHFRFEWRGKRRFHQKPSGLHQRACRPLLEAELERISPKTIVALGSTAGQAMLGRAVRLADVRGRAWPHASGAKLWVTNHPAAILRAPTEDEQEAAKVAFIDDLRNALTTK